jgi:hypothetical protein
VHADIHGKFGNERAALKEGLKQQPVNKKRKLNFNVGETIERRKEAFDDATALFFTTTMSSFNIIEQQSFLKMIEAARASKSKPMSRRQLMRHIETKVEESLAEIKKILEKVPSAATTVDIWSSKQHSYLAVVITWLDGDFNRYLRLLACEPFDNPHTGDRIAEVLDSVHMEFGLTTRKLVETTTDSASNNLAAFKKFGIKNMPLPLENDEELDDDKVFEEDDDDSAAEEEEEELPESIEQREKKILPLHFR